MSKEIEKRFFKFDRLHIEKILRDVGAVKKGTYLFKVVQFNAHPPIKTLRVRDEGFRVTFTMKETTDDYDIENEVVVSNFSEMRTMLTKLGYAEKYYMEKLREIYGIGESELIVDHCPGLPGYIEIEAPTEEKLNELIETFGLDPRETVRNFSSVYKELYQTGVDDLGYLHISFGNLAETVKPLVQTNMELFEQTVEDQKKIMESVTPTNPSRRSCPA